MLASRARASETGLTGEIFDDVLWIVIDQLEPVLGDVGSRENIVLDVLGVKGQLQIRFPNSLLLLRWRWPA